MNNENKYLTPKQCLLLRSLNIVRQGISQYVWHKDKCLGWILYRRNKYDISSYGDKFGYNRWVTAVPKNYINKAILKD